MTTSSQLSGAPARTESASSGISRRTIVQGAAWSVPVIAAAVAVPMAAASNEPAPAPEATQSQISVDQSFPAGEWGQIVVRGRATQGNRPVNGALPDNASIILTPAPAGVALNIDPADQVGVASISGPDGSGSYTIIPVPGAIEVSFYATLVTPGEATVIVNGSAPGGPAVGIWS